MSQRIGSQHQALGWRLPEPAWELYRRLSVNFIVRRHLTTEIKQAIMLRLVEVARQRKNYLMHDDLLPIPKELVDRVQNYAESLEDSAIAHHRK